MITYLLPSRNRPDRLAHTLGVLGALPASGHAGIGGAEVVVVDDASAEPVTVPDRLDNGWPVVLLRLDEPRGAAARNAGAAAARGTWLVMLDDDSAPLDDGVVAAVAGAADDVAAIGAEIVLPDGRHEAGGLPEVIVGCGAAVRRAAFLEAGGYDAAFHYYAEEYDLCAKLLLAGHRVIHDWRFRVRHEKVAEGRDMNTIVRRLVRNNGWVGQRYAPDTERDGFLQAVILRYATIADREDAEFGYQRGLDELLLTVDRQPRTPMPMPLWERFTGLTVARAALARVDRRRARVVDAGKHAWVVERALAAGGGWPPASPPAARQETLVIGTLSPGPMMDAWTRRTGAGAAAVARPWTPEHAARGEAVA